MHREIILKASIHFINAGILTRRAGARQAAAIQYLMAKEKEKAISSFLLFSSPIAKEDRGVPSSENSD
jgi:hypothetical protein